MITLFVRRPAPLVALAALLVGFMRPQQVPPARSDMWFRLRFGHEFLGGWDLDSPGSLGSFDSASWIPTQWLPQVAMAWLEDRGGLDTVVWAVGVVIMVPIVLLYAACRSLAAPLPSAMAVVIGSVAASPGLSARRQVLSYLFVVVTVAA